MHSKTACLRKLCHSQGAKMSTGIFLVLHHPPTMFAHTLVQFMYPGEQYWVLRQFSDSWGASPPSPCWYTAAATPYVFLTDCLQNISPYHKGAEELMTAAVLSWGGHTLIVISPHQWIINRRHYCFTSISHRPNYMVTLLINCWIHMVRWGLIAWL